MATDRTRLGRHGLFVLVDGASLFAAAASLAFEVDYIKLLDVLCQGRRLLQAYFYTGISPGNQKQQAFLHWMQNNRYRVVSKELQTEPGGRRTADLSVEIAIDLLLLADHCEGIVLVSHNGNLAYAIAAATNRGMQIELVGLRSQMSEDLLNLGDRFIDIAVLQPKIQRD
jgi:uncharacterized LabA/DUF88 family protein